MEKEDKDTPGISFGCRINTMGSPNRIANSAYGEVTLSFGTAGDIEVYLKSDKESWEVLRQLMPVLTNHTSTKLCQALMMVAEAIREGHEPE